MSSRKRKEKPPEKFCEEKRAKMTWTMYDMARSSCNESAIAFSSTCLEDRDEAVSNRRGSSSAKRNKKQADKPKNLELNLDNTSSQHCVCQLGVFNISLCISKKQQDEVRMHGPNHGFSSSSPHLSDEQCSNGKFPSVIVNLSFESPLSSSPSSETVDLCDKNSTNDEVDPVRQVSFRAVVPCISKDKLEALVYLQNKGIISLILSPEQHILRDCWEVMVCLNESGLTQLPFASADSRNRKIDKLMKLVMAWFYNCSLENDLAAHEREDVVVDKGFDELYDSIKAIREKDYTSNSAKSSLCDPNMTWQKCDEYCNGEYNRPNGLIAADVQHPDLKPVLRGYQRKAVDWMLRREHGCELSCVGNQNESDTTHPLWREVHTLDGKLIYFNPYTGRLTKERFLLPLLPLGGILADEMGLGKTVEVIACILCHPKPSFEHKSYVDNRTAHQDLSTSQANGARYLMPCTRSSISNSSPAQAYQSHQGETNSIAIKPHHNSQDDSETTHLYVNANPMNTGKLLVYSFQGSSSNSQPVECDIYSKDETNKSKTLESDQNFLNGVRTASSCSSTCHTRKLNMSKTVASDVQECSNIKCTDSSDILSQEGTHDCTVKSDQDCVENHHDLPDVTCSKNSNSSKGDHGKLARDSINMNAEAVATEKDCTSLTHSETLCSCQNSDSSKTVFCALHSGLSSGHLEPEDVFYSKNSNADDLSSGQDASEVGNAASYMPVEETVTVKCQCICGVTVASCDDRPLQCCGCQAIFHADCLQYKCAKEFICPQCALKQPAVPSRTTLIISPAPIAQQWVDEISRHTEPSSLKLLVYEGVAKSGFILPEVLADHDIILTTYSTLRSDFYHLGSKQERSMRYDKRYTALPSPLTGVLFWRICLDEAQMVESTTAKAAEVALHLSGVHKWCVTGTPIQKGLADIYGLLLFLGVDPYCHQRWWKTLLYEPYRNGQRQPLYNILAKIMWRNAKRDVIHEVQTRL